jgi:hypothetical protein
MVRCKTREAVIYIDAALNDTEWKVGMDAVRAVLIPLHGAVSDITLDWRTPLKPWYNCYLQQDSNPVPNIKKLP